MSRGAKGPRIIVDLSDELARQLSTKRFQEAIDKSMSEEASLDVKTSAAFLGISETEFRRRAKRIPAIEYGERTTRYRRKDLIAYRDKHIVHPKK